MSLKHLLLKITKYKKKKEKEKKKGWVSPLLPFMLSLDRGEVHGKGWKCLINFVWIFLKGEGKWFE